MKAIPLRQWSTPAVIGAGLFVTITGVMMFLGVHHPIQHAHEWIGLVFAAGIALHIVNHWRVFKGYFAQPLALGILAAVVLASAVLMLDSAQEKGGHGVGRIIHSIEAAPLTAVAPLLDQGPEAVVTRVRSAGYVVEGMDQSIEQIAAASGAEPKALVRLLFD